jgi:hypothetical protein
MMKNGERMLREQIAERIRVEILPNSPTHPNGRIHDRYNCCGCSTYAAIADDCIDIVLGDTEEPADDRVAA